MSRSRNLMAALAAAGAVLATQASADTVNWADLTQTDNATFANGSIDVSGTAVGVSVTGAGFAFVQTNGGTYYWTEPDPNNRPYTGGAVTNAPPDADIVAFNQGGLKTITFDRAVTDPYLALISWNGNAGTFDQPFDVVSQGCGYYGCGSFTNVTPTSFVASGELHGIIRFQGTFTSVSFTDRSEYWHGIQVGIAGIAATPGVPEPATWAMMIAGFGLVGGAMRRRARVAVAFG